MCSLPFFANSYLFTCFLLLKITLFKTVHTVLGDRRLDLRFSDENFFTIATPTNLQNDRIIFLCCEKNPDSNKSLAKRTSTLQQHLRHSVKIVTYQTHTWRPLVYYALINIKLTLCHLLLYVVYMCQKS